jgi:ATP-dependent helicase/nuclease subunit A
LAAREAHFQGAERERLLYVAATRARRELVVARLERRDTKGGEARESAALWKPFDAALLGCGASLECAVAEAPGRQRLSRTAAELRARIEGLTAQRSGAGRATIATTSVTRSAKTEHTENRAGDAAWASGSGEQKVQGRGKAWGSAVHRVIEGRGRGRTGEALVAFARAVAVDEGLAPAPGSADAAAVGAVEVVAAELATTAERACASVAGQGSDGAATRRFEWAVALTDTGADGVQRVTEGVIDAAAFDGHTWQVLDWKTDDVDAVTWAERALAYQAQVDRYAAIIAKLRGEPAQGTLRRTGEGKGSRKPIADS